MLQSFTAATRPEQGPPRLKALREELARRDLTGFLVPRADAHQGEYVAARDERLAWLTGFTGSAGFAIILPAIAGVFVDGRYRLQVRAQCDGAVFTPVDWPETPAGEWLAAHAPAGAVIGFDPWLHTPDEITRIEAALKANGIVLRAVDDNPIDAIWPDQPAPPRGAVRAHPESLAGRSAAEKRAEIAATLQRAGQTAVALTLPDSLSWLLNIRGADIPRNPVVQAFAILHDDARLDLFIDRAKLGDLDLDGITLHAPEAFEGATPGEPLPYGTVIIMADTRARVDAQGNPLVDHSGRFIPVPGWIAVAVQQKERGWGEGYGPEKRNGEWEYARFMGDGRRNPASVAGRHWQSSIARAPT